MKQTRLSIKHRRALSLALALTLLTPVIAPLFPARAADQPLAKFMLRLDRMTASEVDNRVLVVFATDDVATDTTITLNFDDAFTIDDVASNIALSTTGIDTETVGGVTLTACPGIAGSDTADAIVGAGTDESFSVNISDLTANTLYGFYITAGLDNPAGVNQYVNSINIEQGTDDDISQSAIRIIGNDQVVITATVPPTFYFALDGNSDTFTGNLDTGAVVSTNGVQVNLRTNANNGWSTWLKSANAGLDSASSGDTIDTVGTVNAAPTDLDPTSIGTEAYVLDVDKTDSVTAGTGAVTVSAEYDGAADSGGTFTTSFTEIAYADGPTDNDYLDLYARVTISGLTQAATDYTDTWTVVGAANF